MVHVLTIAAFVVPLGLDTFALSAALGVVGLSANERLRASLILTGFEAGMPFVGFLIGSGIGTAVGKYSDYAAAAVLVGVGVFMLWPRDEEDEGEKVVLLQRARGAAILGLGLGISLDELAIGFGGGLLRLPLLILAILNRSAGVPRCPSRNAPRIEARRRRTGMGRTYRRNAADWSRCTCRGRETSRTVIRFDDPARELRTTMVQCMEISVKYR